MTPLMMSRFNKVVPMTHKGQEMVALYNTLARSLTLLLAVVWDKVKMALNTPGKSRLLDELVRQGFLVHREVDETALLRIWRQQYIHDTSILKFRALGERGCSFGCAYCILDPEAGKMKRKTARAMVDFLCTQIVRTSAKRVFGNYLGGEPLLNLPMILETSALLDHFCRGRDISLDLGITCNGYHLKPHVVKRLQAAGVNYARVSLAGPRDVHNRLRPLKNGAPTYDEIMIHLMLVSFWFDIIIEYQYDAGSLDYQGYPDMLDDLARRGIRIKAVYFTPILAKPGESHFNAGLGDPEIYTYLTAETQKRGYPVFEDPPTSYCMADARQYYVIDFNGNLLACPSLGSLTPHRYGNVFDGVDFIAETQILKRHLPEQCESSCDIAPFCSGGCRLQSEIHTGDFNGTDCQYEALDRQLDAYIRYQAGKVLANAGPLENVEI